jgi:hypothetical protein
MTLNEKDFKLFKKWLTSHLAFGPVTITFTKKDGTERVMECTTNTDLVPQEPIVESIEIKKEKKANEEVMPVYDLEAKGWRSFRWDSVKQVTLKIGEEREYDTSPQ